MDGASYKIKRFLPQLEESPKDFIIGPFTSVKQMPKLTPAPKAGKIMKRRKSEYFPRKQRARVPVSLDDSYVQKRRRSKEEISNDRLKEFMKKQEEELERIQLVNSRQNDNQESSSINSSAATEKKNQESATTLTSQQSAIATKFINQEPSLTPTNLHCYEKVIDENSQQQASPSFKVPQSPEEKPRINKWPRKKTVTQDFHRVSNIAYASVRFKNLFKCVSSSCNFKSTNMKLFEDHLVSHHSQDKTLKSHTNCNICLGPIEASSLADEFTHMLTFHVQREKTLNDLISSLDGSVENKTFKSKLKIKIDCKLNHEDSSVFNTPPYTKEDDNRVYDEVELKIKNLFESSDLRKSSQEDLKSERFFEAPSKIRIAPSEGKIFVPSENIMVTPMKIADTTTHQQPPEKSEKVKESNFRSLDVDPIKNSLIVEENLDTKVSDECEKKVPSTLLPQSISMDSSETFAKTFKRSLSVARQQATDENERRIEQNKKMMITKPNDFVHQLIREEKSSCAALLKSPHALQRSQSYQHERSNESIVIRDPSLSRKSLDSHQSPVKSFNCSLENTSNAASASPSISQIKKVTMEARQLKILSPAELMPWISHKLLRKNEKYEICHKKMLTKVSLVANFKCMSRVCSFTTSDANLFISHLGFHENESNPDKFALLCSYCVYKGKTAKDLTNHIYNIHTKDIFQCPKCFYRSREKKTCHQHIRKQHGNENLKILECPEQDLDLKSEKQEQLMMERLKRKRCEFVQHIRCKCEFKTDR